jgi:cytochrome P450
VLLTVGTKITLYVVAEHLKWHRRLLGRHQGVLEQVRDEIASLVGLGPDARQPTQDELTRMTYLGLAIKESLRLYPPAPVNQ